MVQSLSFHQKVQGVIQAVCSKLFLEEIVEALCHKGVVVSSVRSDLRPLYIIGLVQWEVAEALLLPCC